MKGYWGQKELTKKSLYKKERIPACEEVFYRTGDFVKQNDEGNLIFVGRKDRQIKLRGYRIELNEIESVLMKVANINETAVYTFKNKNNEISIAAMVVMKNDVEVEENKFQVKLNEYLPRYVKLDKISFSDKIPRTSAGKINYKLLEKEASVN